jgi:hypothetical protein
MSPPLGRQDRPAKAEMHRIEEAVAALYRFEPLQIPGAEANSPSNYTVFT